jgi:hypothetical protein
MLYGKKTKVAILKGLVNNSIIWPIRVIKSGIMKWMYHVACTLNKFLSFSQKSRRRILLRRLRFVREYNLLSLAVGVVVILQKFMKFGVILL